MSYTFLFVSICISKRNLMKLCFKIICLNELKKCDLANSVYFQSGQKTTIGFVFTQQKKKKRNNGRKLILCISVFLSLYFCKFYIVMHLRAKCILQPVRKLKRETNQNTKQPKQNCIAAGTLHDFFFFASITCIFNAIIKFCLQQSGSVVKNSKLGKQDTASLIFEIHNRRTISMKRNVRHDYHEFFKLSIIELLIYYF